jgi:hypothetical protein
MPDDIINIGKLPPPPSNNTNYRNTENPEQKKLEFDHFHQFEENNAENNILRQTNKEAISNTKFVSTNQELELPLPETNDSISKNKQLVLQLYGLNRELQTVPNPKKIKDFIKIIANRPLPLPEHKVGKVIIGFLNIITSIVSSGFIIGKLLTVLFTLLAIKAAESVHNSNKKEHLMIIITVVAYAIAVALSCVSTITSTNSPLANLKNIDTNLSRDLIKFADRFAQVIRVTTQIFFALTCIALIILSSSGGGLSLLVAIQSLAELPVFGTFITFTSSWILQSTLTLTIINTISIIFLSTWAFFAIKATIAFITRKIQQNYYNHLFKKMIDPKQNNKWDRSVYIFDKYNLKKQSSQQVDTITQSLINHAKQLCASKEYAKARNDLKNMIFKVVNDNNNVDDIHSIIFKLSNTVFSKLSHEQENKTLLFYDFHKFMGSILYNYKSYTFSIKHPILTVLLGIRTSIPSQLSDLTQKEISTTNTEVEKLSIKNESSSLPELFECNHEVRSIDSESEEEK